MGNYRGTVRCGVCYQTGHNKRSCPKQTERLQSRLENYQSRQDQTQPYVIAQIDRLATELGKRTGTNPVTQAKIIKRGPTRKCSYCKHKHGSYSDEGLGHTRRTCAALKKDKADAIAANAVYRTGVLEGLRESGFGMGALLAFTLSDYFTDPDTGKDSWQRRKVPTMVRQILWNNICYLTSHEYVGRVQRMDKMGTNDGWEGSGAPYRHDAEGNVMRFAPGVGWGETGQRHGCFAAQQDEPDRNTVTLLAPVPATSINPPAGWESGECETIITHFKSCKA